MLMVKRGKGRIETPLNPLRHNSCCRQSGICDISEVSRLNCTTLRMVVENKHGWHQVALQS